MPSDRTDCRYPEGSRRFAKVLEGPLLVLGRFSGTSRAVLCAEERESYGAEHSEADTKRLENEGRIEVFRGGISPYRVQHLGWR